MDDADGAHEAFARGATAGARGALVRFGSSRNKLSRLKALVNDTKFHSNPSGPLKRYCALI